VRLKRLNSALQSVSEKLMKSLGITLIAVLIITSTVFFIPTAGASTGTAIHLSDRNLTDSYGLVLNQFEAEGLAGGTIHYKVWVLNQGSTTDNYSLSILSQTAGWSPAPSISPDSFSNVTPGDNRLADLIVPVPVDASYGATNTITIRVNTNNGAVIIDNSVTICVSQLLKPTYQDVMIRDYASGASVADTHYDNAKAESMYVGTWADASAPGGLDHERAYLQFDLRAIPAGTVINNSHPAILTLLAYSGWPGGGDQGVYDVYWVENDNWAEENVTWNNNPGYDNLILQQHITGLSYGAGAPSTWLWFNITSAVENEFNHGNNILSLCIKLENENYNGSLSLRTKQYVETSDLWPYLYISERNIWVDVSISPSSQNGAEGATLTYTVTITNNRGDASDNYVLTVADNAQWSTSISPTSLLIPAFDFGTATLNVTIPDNAVLGTIDNITVMATSQADNTVGDSAGCTAQVVTIRGISVSISPTSRSGADNVTLTFMVTVHNLGNVADNYSLTLTDNASPSWSPSVSPSSLGVSAGDSSTVTLNVTIPPGAIRGSIDNIMIVATSQIDNTVSDNASCIASVLNYDEIVTLYAGWNLVNFRIENQFWMYGTDYLIYSWNAPGGPFVLQSPGLAERENIGYWVYVKQNMTVYTTYTGSIPRNIYLENGWNLVGFPITDENTTPNNIFWPLVYYTNYIIYGWTTGSGPYSMVFPTQALQDYLGYWVWIDRDWTVGVP
jgi:uncharacterized membrane protein